MMRTFRRQDMTARVEIMPLIDVIFLLLTFFVYSLTALFILALAELLLFAEGFGVFWFVSVLFLNRFRKLPKIYFGEAGVVSECQAVRLYMNQFNVRIGSPRYVGNIFRPCVERIGQ